MTIPVSNIVTVNPNVITSGGNPLALNGVILSKSTLLPINEVKSFDSADSVTMFFGPSDSLTSVAETYFLGFDNSTIKPGTLYMAPYTDVDGRGPWIQSGVFTEDELDSLSTTGSLRVIVDGINRHSETLTLTASSFSSIANQLQDALSPVTALDTLTISAATDTFSFTTTTNITEYVGYCIYGTGIQSDTIILSTSVNSNIYTGVCSKDFVTISNGNANIKYPKINISWNSTLSCFRLVNTYRSSNSTIHYATGSLSTLLKLTAATGATLSQGSDADTPTSAMNNVKRVTQNWVDFTTLWEPTLVEKKEFATWTNAQNNRYMYVAWDTDVNAIVNGNTTCFGAVAKSLAYNGVIAVYNTVELASFVLGTVASIDFGRLNGRITPAFKHQSGFTPTVTDQQISTNLLENGYSFYGSYATANDQFNFFYNGQMAGQWKWLDTFINQVYMNSQFQLALINLLTSVKSIPYNESGYALIRAAMTDPINSALNFGGIRIGVSLSESQNAQVRNDAGKDVKEYLESYGYYLQILDPGSLVRGNRGSPIVNFWYTDGSAVQKISVSSTDIL